MKHIDDNNVGNITLGALGEAAVEAFLIKRGHKIIARNFRRKVGEIDIVSQYKGVTHFVEVKTSNAVKNSSFSPEMRINRRKSRSIIRACEVFIREYRFTDERIWQIDVAAVLLGQEEDGIAPRIDFLENAIHDSRS